MNINDLSEEEQLEEAKIIIHSNGSQFAGEAYASLEDLFVALKENDLDICHFSLYGFVRFREDGSVRVWGNFLNLSYVFDIEGPAEAPSIKKLTILIAENIKNCFAKFKGGPR